MKRVPYGLERGEKGLLSSPGSELGLETEKEKEKCETIDGMSKNIKTK